MKKIEFINDSAPYLSAENLNLLQDNVEEGIEESKLEEYSTSEQRIGTWLGKPLYRKVIQTTIPTSGNQQKVSVETNIETMLPLRGFAFQSAGTNRVNLTLPYTSGSTAINAYYNIIDKNIIIQNSITWMENQPCYIILEYTKTTD